MTAQVAVDGEEPFSFQLEEDGIDELHHIVVAESWQMGVYLGHQLDAAPLAWLSGKVDVARIVLPEVSVRGYRHFVSQLSQSFGQRPVYVAIFAKQ